MAYHDFSAKMNFSLIVKHTKKHKESTLTYTQCTLHLFLSKGVIIYTFFSSLPSVCDSDTKWKGPPHDGLTQPIGSTDPETLALSHPSAKTQQIAKLTLGILLIFSEKEETLSQFYENIKICRWFLDFLMKALSACAGYNIQKQIVPI